MNLQFSISMGQHEYFIISGQFQDSPAPIWNTGRIYSEAAMILLLLFWVICLVVSVACDLILDVMKEIILLMLAQMLEMLAKNAVLFRNMYLESILGVLVVLVAHLIGIAIDLFKFGE